MDDEDYIDLDDYPDDEPGDTELCVRCNGETVVGDPAFPLPCPVCQRSGVVVTL